VIITAALSWYDEPVDELVACVGALAGVADRLVAYDGAYRRYPGGKARSPREQVRAIQTTAKAAGIECLVMQPNKPWAGQVEKRTHLVNAACINSDWIMIVDSDYVVRPNGADVHAELDAFTEAVIDIPYVYPFDPAAQMEEAAATAWAQGLAGKSVLTPHFIRAVPGMRYESYHYRLSGIVNGRREWLDFSDPTDHSYPYAPHHKGLASYEVEHRCMLRTPEKVLGNRAFCNDRFWIVAATGQEDDVPGLDPPVWEYERRLV